MWSPASLSASRRKTMLDFVNEAVSNKVSLLATDSWPGYSDYLRQFPHAKVDHSKQPICCRRGPHEHD